MYRVNCRQIFATFIVCFLHMSDGCGRTPARTKPHETTPNPVEKTSSGPSGHAPDPHSGHARVCSQDQIKDTACLNGGVCFALEFMEGSITYCQCPEIWRGSRCEVFDDSIYVLSADKVEKAGIAAGVVVLIILVTVVIVYLVVKKRKQRKQRTEANGSANGHAGKALMGCEKANFESEDGEKCTDV